MPLSKEQVIDLARHVDIFGAQNVTVLDISAQADWGSYVLVASFSGSRQGLGILAQVSTWLREHNSEIKVSDQSPENSWFICDAGDVIVHLFKEETRDYYALETQWKETQIIYPSVDRTSECEI